MSLPSHAPDPQEENDANTPQLACVMVFNASDPSGAGGLAGDITAVASVGAYALPVVTGAYSRDTTEIFDHFPFDDEAVTEQARTLLEDVAVQVFDRRDRVRLCRHSGGGLHAQSFLVD